MSLDLENINLGATAGDKTGDGARTGGGKINRNFEKIKAFLETPDAILVQTGYALVGQDLTFNSGWKWRIATLEYTNPEDVEIPFPLAAAGKSRLDVVVLTTSNTFLRVPGAESTSTPVAPSAPSGSLYVTVVLVTDGVVNQPEQPEVNGAYVQKSERSNVVLTGSGVINQLNLVDEKATIVFKDAITRLNTISYASVPYNGKRITLFNAQATPVTIGHSVSGYGVDFVFADGQDYVLSPNQTIEFSFDITFAPYAHHMLIGSKGIATWSELQGKPSTFPPSAHTHLISEVVNLENELNGKASTNALDYLQLNKEDQANKNIANGYAGLDSSGKIIPTQLPALAITDTFVVASQAEQLALVAEVGDVAVRTDLNKSFILKVTGASTLANWQELLSPTSVDQTIIDGSTNAVSGNAVFDGLALKSNIGHTHVASQITDLSKASVGLGNVDNTSDLSKPLSTATIDALATKAPISSVHNQVTLGTANGLSLATQQLSLGLASSGITGALSGTDWNTFNNKQNALTNPITGTGVNGQISFWNGTNSQTGDSGLFWDNTNKRLGIGVTNPVGKMEINLGYSRSIDLVNQTNGSISFANPGSSVQVPGIVGKSSNNRGLMLVAGTADSNSVPDMEFNVRKNDGNDYTTFTNSAFRFSSFSTNLVEILRNGNVGIGKTAPTEKLDVVGNGKFSGTISASPATTANQVPTWGQVQAAAKPYKVYTALLTQTGTNAPVATVLENTLGGTVTFERAGVGNYNAVSVGNLFTLNKTVVFNSSGQFVGTYNFYPANTSRVALNNVNVSGVVADSLMQELSIEIRVYL